ncbi:MAG: hypothetical protein Kow0010_24180 [Dehalococcoidia bacterium]
MLRIRLRRVGKRRHPYYRVVVADQRAKRDGRFVEMLGSYDPHADPPLARLDEERAREWLAKGAQPSEAAEKILRRAGILQENATGRRQQAGEAPAAAATAVADKQDEPKAATAEAPAEEPNEAEAAGNDDAVSEDD